MIGFGEGALDNGAHRDAEAPRVVRASSSVNWLVAILMTAILIAAIAGVVVALSSGVPTVAILIALVTGAVFAGVAC